MPETLLSPVHEPVSGIPDPIDIYNQAIMPDALENFGQRIVHESQQFNFDRESSGIREREDELIAQLQPYSSEDEVAKIGTERAELKSRLDHARYLDDFMRSRNELYKVSGTTLYGAFETEARPLINAIVGNAKTDESEFISQVTIDPIIDKSDKGIDIDARMDPVTIPLNAVVSAEAFKSWEQGRGKDSMKDDKPSSEVIRDYSERPTDIPPVDVAKALIQPDGSVIFVSENAHRVAAAKLKGQETIEVKYIPVRKLTAMLTSPR